MVIKKNTEVVVYPYNADNLTQTEKLAIPAIFRHGGNFLGYGVDYYMEGSMVEDDGEDFVIKRNDNGLEHDFSWVDIYKVVTISDETGRTTHMGRDAEQPESTDSADAPLGDFIGPQDFVGPRNKEFYGGDKGTDGIRKDGMGMYVILGICAVGVVLYVKRW